MFNYTYTDGDSTTYCDQDMEYNFPTGMNEKLIKIKKKHIVLRHVQ